MRLNSNCFEKASHILFIYLVIGQLQRFSEILLVRRLFQNLNRRFDHDVVLIDSIEQHVYVLDRRFKDGSVCLKMLNHVFIKGFRLVSPCFVIQLLIFKMSLLLNLFIGKLRDLLDEKLLISIPKKVSEELQQSVFPPSKIPL